LVKGTKRAIAGCTGKSACRGWASVEITVDNFRQFREKTSVFSLVNRSMILIGSATPYLSTDMRKVPGCAGGFIGARLQKSIGRGFHSIA
jgi:hypothetical protein